MISGMIQATKKLIKAGMIEQRGNVAALFGLAAVPLIVAAGVAVDYGSATNMRTQLQAALDSAALAAASDFSKSDSEITTIANNVFNANFDASLGTASLDTTILANRTGVRVTGTVSSEPAFMRIAGYSNLDITASAESHMATNATELVIVMDTTGSMSFGTSWEDAKNVINQTVQTLSDLSSNGNDFVVTLLPISDRVNVGVSKATWLSVATPPSWNGCMAPREEPNPNFPYSLTDKSPAQLGFLPSAIGYDDVYDNANASWVDHGTNSDPNDDNLPICPVGITGPTNDPADIQAALDALSPQGTGRFDEAMAWAWRLVSPKWVGLWGEPDYPKPYEQRKKVVVFISDGLTEAYRHEVGGDGNDVSPPNTLYGWNKGSKWGFEHLVGVCEQMKSEGVEIHMIKVNGNPKAKQFFKDCATTSKNFYEVQDADDFQVAIATIQKRVIGLRLTK